MKVAVLGLGLMGAPIAERVLAAGHDLTVYNRTPEKGDGLVAAGAVRAESPRDLLAGSDVCITMIADDAALESVTLGQGGVLEGARPGTVLVDMSTVSVDASCRVADVAAAREVAYLRAPVSGNPGVVRAGNLTIVVSGPTAAFERLAELLRAIGPNVYHVGEGEEARVVKLALAIMIAGTAELMAEAMLLGEAGGVSRADLLEVMGNSAVGSPFVKYKTGPLLQDDYSATFTSSMMKKDIGLCLALAGSGRRSFPVTRELDRLLGETIAADHADSDFMTIFLTLREQALAEGWAPVPAAP
jgi:3-hydroxyisobutyrate dehydrogenase-like beta-hydroxyacid dehydrogenase